MHRHSMCAPTGARLVAVFALLVGACVSGAGSAPQVDGGPEGGGGEVGFDSKDDGLGAEKEPPGSDPAGPSQSGSDAGPGRRRPFAGVAAGHGLLASPSFRMAVEVGRGGSGGAQGNSIRMTSAAAFVEMEESR